MKLQKYEDMQVDIIRHTVYPGSLVKLALNITQKKQGVESGSTVSTDALAFIINANHGSVIEHVSFTFFIQGVSRAFLAQITRHRMASYTSASQHYQDYRDYPMTCDDPEVLQLELEASLEVYKDLIDRKGLKPEEARMVLPNAACVNILWTINARSFANFVSQRQCRRNVKEMQVFTFLALYEVNKIWPEYARVLGPECYRLGKCLQGKMTCGNPFDKSEYGGVKL